MEINLGNVKFTKGFTISIYLITIVSPLIVFLLIYDVKLLLQLDTFKLIIISIGLGGFLFTINLSFTTIFVEVMDRIGNKKKEVIEDYDFDIADILAIFSYTVANLCTIGNLIRLKYFLYEDKRFWIIASIETWTLSIILTIFTLIIVGICTYLYRKTRKIS